MWGIEFKDVAIFIAGIVITVVVGFIFYRLSVQRKRLSYGVEKSVLVKRGSKWPSELTLSYKGNAVQSLLFFQIYVWNGGNQVILRSDLSTKSPLEFSLTEDVKVLHVAFTRQSRAANAVELAGLHPTFEFLNAGDGFVVEMFADGPELRSNAWLKGDIVGAAGAPVRRDASLAKSVLLRLILLVIGALFFPVGAAVLFGLLTGEIPKSWHEPIGATIQAGLALVLGSLFSFIGGICLVTAIGNLFSSRIPRELLDERWNLRGRLDRWMSRQGPAQEP